MTAPRNLPSTRSDELVLLWEIDIRTSEHLYPAILSQVAPSAIGSYPADLLQPLTIEELIPHRAPSLLIDRVEIIEAGTRALGTKYVTSREPFFEGHFPARRIMPGVLIVEALAQTSGVLLKATGEFDHKEGYLVGIERARFRSFVMPGSILKLAVEVVRRRRRGAKVRGIACVSGTVVCTAELTSWCS